MSATKHVSGADKGKLLLFALSTCIWCKKTKKLLEALGVDYYYIDVDLVPHDERDEVVAELKSWNPQSSFPTLVINNQKTIIGFNEPQIRTELEK